MLFLAICFWVAVWACGGLGIYTLFGDSNERRVTYMLVGPILAVVLGAVVAVGSVWEFLWER